MSFSGKSKSNAVSGPKRTARAARQSLEDLRRPTYRDRVAPKPAKTVSPLESIDKMVSQIVAKAPPSFDPWHPLPVRTLFGKGRLLARREPPVKGGNVEVVQRASPDQNQKKAKVPPSPGKTWSITTASLGPELFARNSNRQRLSSHGKLKLALSVRPDGKGVDVGKLSDFAQSTVESEMILVIQKMKPDLLAGYTDPLKALAMLRIYHIPMMCFWLIKEILKEKGQSSYWLGLLASQVHALTRTVCERKLYCGTQNVRGDRNGLNNDAVGRWEREFIKPLFAGSCDELLFWMSRFDDWRSHAAKSWGYYLAKQSSDIRNLKGGLQEAAILGILKYLNSLPSKWFADRERKVQEVPELRRVFRKNARPSRYEAKLPGTDLKTWLIEIWPLVRNYGWNSEQLRRVVQRKFVDLTLRTLDNPVEFKKLCKEIKLRLKVEPGRPPNDHRNSRRLPRLAALALAIDGIDTAAHQWLAWRWSVPTDKVKR